MSRYPEIYRQWQSDPQAFWSEAALGIDWVKPWEQVYAKLDGLDRWFVGAECNTCFNAVDRHVEAGHGARLALIYDSPLAGRKQRFSYGELQDEVATLAAVLADLGIGKGDRVLIYMPMIPQAVFAMLASAAAGSLFRRTAPATAVAYATLLAVCGAPLLIWLGRDAPFGRDVVGAALTVNPVAAALSVIRVQGFRDYQLVPANWWFLGAASVLSLIVFLFQTYRISRPQ